MLGTHSIELFSFSLRICVFDVGRLYSSSDPCYGSVVKSTKLFGVEVRSCPRNCTYQKPTVPAVGFSFSGQNLIQPSRSVC